MHVNPTPSQLKSGVAEPSPRLPACSESQRNSDPAKDAGIALSVAARKPVADLVASEVVAIASGARAARPYLVYTLPAAEVGAILKEQGLSVRDIPEVLPHLEKDLRRIIARGGRSLVVVHGVLPSQREKGIHVFAAVRQHPGFEGDIRAIFSSKRRESNR